MSLAAVSQVPRPNVARLRRFVGALAELVERERDEAVLLGSGASLLAALVASDDWLPEAYARPHPDRYQQYLLYCDARERFSVVSFVWGPGQRTPVHDHRVWGLVGVLRGRERVQGFVRRSGVLFPAGPERELRAGEVEHFSPAGGNDLHQVSNGVANGVSVSIHVYGANIGAVERATYGPDAEPRRFVSGYANTDLPNLWDRSEELR